MDRSAHESVHASGRVRRRTDAILVTVLVVLPLLPAGPRYLGFDWPWLFEAVFAAASAVLLLATVGERRAGTAPAWPAAHLIRRGYLTWLVAAAGAAAIGVFGALPPDLTLVRYELQGGLSRLFGPIDQAVDPLYPLRVFLTFAEGALAFWVFSRVLNAPGAPVNRARLAARACLAATALVSVLALAQYVTRYELHPYWVAANPHLVRSHATIEDPNALGSFLLLGMGLAFGMAWSAPRGWAGRRQRAAATTTLILATMAVGTTVSRSAWLAALLATVWIAGLAPLRLFDNARRAITVRQTARRLALATAVFVVVWLSARVLVTAEVSTQPDGPVGVVVQSLDPRTPLRTLSKERVVMWSAAFDLFRDHPLAGAGLGRFPGFYRTVPGSTSAENAHNFYLQMLAETGTLGFLALALFALTIVAAFRKNLSGRSRRLGRLGYGLAAGLIAFAASALTGHPLLTVSNQVWLAAILSVGLSLVNPTRSEPLPAAVASTRRPRLSAALKRALDVTASLALLGVLAPLMALIALAIRATSSGPVLFRQERMTRSRNGEGVRPFTLVKFRTMHADTDPYARSPASGEDPRITSIGRYLRRTCLDELPQLWNVLRGDMSLVGPRPEMPWIVETYDDRSRVRLDVQPGLTGLWQLRGRRDRMIHRDLRWDMLYVRHRTLGLDVVILFETLRFAVRARNH